MTSKTVVADVAKEETTRQAIILAFSLAGTVAIVYVMRMIEQPDYARIVKMSSALAVKRFAGKNVDFWQSVSDKAATVYNRERA